MQRQTPTSIPLGLSALFTAAALTACGGDDDAPTPPPPPPAAQTIEGTAAIGAALSKANVAITDKAGAAVCQEATIVTGDTGAYSCTLQSGKTAPFIVVVTDPSGAVAPMVSVGTATPAAGTPLTVNVTPLTTAIVAQLSPDKNALSAIAQPASLDTSALAAITTTVLSQIADVLAAIGAPANYDPFTTPITAATASVAGNTADQVVDMLKISTVNGVTLLATVDNPAAAVQVADANTAQPAKLAAPGNGVTTLFSAMKLLSAALTECFKLDVAHRVLAKDTTIPANAGGPSVITVAAACEDIVHDDYLHNGYTAGQAFYGLLNDDNMTGASFGLPELMRFIDDSSAADHDRAIVNIRYVDQNGNAGNIITVGQKFPGTAGAGRNTDWWLYGNRQPIDSTIRPMLRRFEQLAPGAGSAGPFVNAGVSRFESGLEIFINKDGPNSAGLRAVRVKGPGLPPAGLVYTRPDPSFVVSQSWLNIRRKDGNTDPAAASFAADVGNIYRLQRTVGLTGADATTVRPNPNAGNSNNTAFVNWAHPLDYGAQPGDSQYIDFAQLRAQVAYQFEVYYDGETTARHSYSKTLLAPVVPATNAAPLQWVDLTAATKGYLDPANVLAASQTSIQLAWTANPLAQTIASAGVFTTTAGAPVNQGLVSVTRGATAATANAPKDAQGVTVPFPALTTDGATSRSLQLRYRMLDGSYKDSFTRYN